MYDSGDEVGDDYGRGGGRRVRRVERAAGGGRIGVSAQKQARQKDWLEDLQFAAEQRYAYYAANNKIIATQWYDLVPFSYIFHSSLLTTFNSSLTTD